MVLDLGPNGYGVPDPPHVARNRDPFYAFDVDSRYAVDDGGGQVASVTDRVSNWVFAANTTGNKPSIDTALIPGVKLIRITTIGGGQNLQRVGANSFGGEDTPISFVCRLYRTTTQGRSIMSTHVANSPPSLANGETQLRAVTTTAIRVTRDPTGAAATDYDAATTWLSSAWYTIAISFTGSSIRRFINGTLVSAAASNLGTLGDHTVITLGNRSSLADSMAGYYAAWRGWYRSLSDAEQLAQHQELSAWAA